MPSELPVRSLAAYEKDPGDAFVASWPLDGISVRELRELFGASDDDPMYDTWRVGEEHVARLARAVEHDIDLSAYDYFVEARTRSG